MKINKKAFMNALTAVAVLLIFVGLLGIVSKYSNGFNEDFKTFSLEHNNETISATESKLTFDVGSEQKIYCNYIIKPDDDSFSVSLSADTTNNPHCSCKYC